MTITQRLGWGAFILICAFYLAFFGLMFGKGAVDVVGHGVNTVRSAFTTATQK